MVAAEDQRFPTHHGFDVGAIRRAMNERRGNTRGASTITQQAARNLFLWSGRSWVRKALEALPAEQRMLVDLAYYEGLTQSEIAERTGVPLGTVKTRVRAAMATLRSALAS